MCLEKDFLYGWNMTFFENTCNVTKGKSYLRRKNHVLDDLLVNSD